MKRNAGFGVVGVIAVVVAVLAIGAIAWRVYDTNKNNPTKQSSTSQNDQSSPSPAQTDSGAYLDIKELGIKIKLDDKNKNISYVNAQSLNDEAVYIINPDMKTIDEGNQYCATGHPGSIGLLDRSKDANHWGEMPIQVDNNKSFKVGDYYYVFRSPQSECSQDASISQQRVGYQQAFLSVLKTIKTD